MTFQLQSGCLSSTEDSAYLPGVPSFSEDVCLPFLLKTQNSDGGWGFHPGSHTATEPTCWALLALGPAATTTGDHRAMSATERGLDSLRHTQLADGSWPAFAGQDKGCWVTALACRALHVCGQPEGMTRTVTRGLEWLCNTWPAEGSAWQLFLRRLSRRPSVAKQDSRLRGWSWTPGTASWVEPTAHTLILFRAVPASLHPASAERRRKLAERMLYDRMCPGGGWNSGNPLVYGAAGQPRVSPTVWALLALRDYAGRAENQASLQWLEREYGRIHGAASLVLTRLCLTAYGRTNPADFETRLKSLYSSNQFFDDLETMAWAVLGSQGDSKG